MSESSFDREYRLRRVAVQLCAMLPHDPQEAWDVLSYTQELFEGITPNADEQEAEASGNVTRLFGRSRT